jgi:hypothetical protein
VKKISLILAIFGAMAIALLPHGVAKAATTITDCDGLQAMSSNLAEDYILGNDIDCSATSGWNAGAGFEPVGNSGTKFTGTLDGQNHKITNLFINRPSTNDIGLFGYAQDASVSNVTFQGGSITGQANVGTVAGVADSIVITNVKSNLTIVSTSNYVAGIIGFNHSLTTVTTTLTNVHFSGTVTAPDNTYGVAGLIGDNDANADITYSSNTGNINGGDSTDYVGGLVGDSDAVLNISSSFNSGNISSSGNACCVAGIVGWSDETHLTNVYNIGNITGHDSVGGLLGYVSDGTVINSYSTGLITGVDATQTGALIGNWDALSMTNTFWNTETSGQTVPCGTDYTCSEEATGITSAQMRTQSIFTDATWDFVEDWGICEYFNNGFPYLLWQEPSCTPPTPGLPNTGFGKLQYAYPFI